ncbi:MAG: lamin tail domain-containing protein [Chloroflexi bacterium]|nr:lamin tail domain-containing protein [Chloroflexota bacterium]MCL5273598.1 lamin tail domain-containing protein [Chloroflexota bacterium]
MSTPLTRKQWAIVILVNVVVSTVTALLIVRVLTAQPIPNSMGAAAPTDQPVPVAAADPTQQVSPTQTQAPANTVAAKPTSAPAPKATETSAPTTAVVPSATTPPQSAGNVSISSVLNVGQRQREVVVIVNQGDQVNMKGWTLSSSRSITYTFGNVTLFKDSFISLHTTSGADVPTDLFMNRSDAAWQVGDIITLARQSKTIATFTVKQQ